MATMRAVDIRKRGEIRSLATFLGQAKKEIANEKHCVAVQE